LISKGCKYSSGNLSGIKHSNFFSMKKNKNGEYEETYPPYPGIYYSLFSRYLELKVEKSQVV
jgi:hypothetical protein